MKTLKVLGIIFATILVLFIGFITFVPSGRQMWTDYKASLKESEETNYEARVKVENEARLRIVAYEAAKLEYFTLKSSCETTEDSIVCARADAKRTIVNNLAIQYNNYILENSHYWEDNLPSDINKVLQIIN